MKQMVRRDLDKMVAIERGYRVERQDGRWLLMVPGGGAYVEAATEADAWAYVPDFSTSEAASADLFQGLFDQTDTITCTITLRPDYVRLQVVVGKVHLDVEAPTLPLARCRLYLAYLHKTRYNRL